MFYVSKLHFLLMNRKSAMSQEEELTLEGMDLPAMLREDACRRFANLHCQDIDLLHISRMIMHGGSSLVAVGVCLNVDRTMITAIEEDDLCSRQQDKIHKILTEWQWNNTQNSTWATLTKCLLILEDPKLMDDIQAYLSQKEYPSNGMFPSLTASCRYEMKCCITCHRLSQADTYYNQSINQMF